MSTRPEEAGSIKVGSFVVIDGEPCKVVEVEKSKTGKHGSAKARIVGIGIFDGVKRSLIVPTSSKIEVPVVRKFSGQVIALLPDTVQIMSLEDYSTFELSYPEDEELKSRLSEGVEVEIWEIMGRYKINRVRGVR
ncbi:MAG: translation initiation factor IF-5A [Thermoprotei archaeon]|nr:MAG: translation initiation factor IF-5A [Thermoprotei archaeon]